jgi:hypothetical protein
MLSRPTTEQIILDCRAELLTTISRAVSDPSVAIAIEMMENVLRNCAERAAHEIAWMHDEIGAMIDFAEHVAASPAATAEVAAALAAHRAEPMASLHLDDVCASYSRASECLSAALEAALAAGDDELHAQGRAILDLRLAHERQVMGEWTMVGRA